MERDLGLHWAEALLEAQRILFFFFKILFIFRERGRERQREGEKHQCVVASCAPPTGDLACNPGMSIHWATPVRATANSLWDLNSLSQSHLPICLFRLSNPDYFWSLPCLVFSLRCDQPLISLVFLSVTYIFTISLPPEIFFPLWPLELLFPGKQTPPYIPPFWSKYPPLLKADFSLRKHVSCISPRNAALSPTLRYKTSQSHQLWIRTRTQFVFVPSFPPPVKPWPPKFPHDPRGALTCTFALLTKIFIWAHCLKLLEAGLDAARSCSVGPATQRWQVVHRSEAPISTLVSPRPPSLIGPVIIQSLQLLPEPLRVSISLSFTMSSTHQVAMSFSSVLFSIFPQLYSDIIDK